MSTPLWAWFVAVVLSLLFGRSRPFLNWSTHHPLYSARLIRAYLGASNLDRLLSPQEGAVTNIIPKDDISLTDYWRGSAIQGKDPPFEKGAPLHLINVTINETYDGRSQIQQKDRQGVGMALGPAAISAGVKHHAVFPVDGQTGYMERIIETYPTEDNYRVFDYSGKQFSGERLSLGRWVSISGAAFSTGLGSKTHLGLSLLAGFGNIRLGYWWNSGIKRPSPGNERFAHKLGALLEKTFPVQTYLLYEFRAHFSGTAHRDWYLSDGGHFENMGGYELIRRRLRKIVIIDAEADPDYTFEGLANLVRKARLDFQAEIHFLDEDALDEHLDDDIRRYFGSIETLRRGRWTEEPITDPNDSKRSRKRVSIDPVDHTRLSRAHAALARVYYDGEAHPTSWLLYIKPTLLGDEPTDVLQYHAAHNRFPQEPTSDQFFDEAQWESYRMLGEYIANKIFQKRLARMPEKPLNKKFVSELFNFR